MNQCRSPPSKLYCFGSVEEKRAIKALHAYKLDDPDNDILNLDLAKEQLKNKGNGAYILLFTSKANASSFVSAHGVAGVNTAMYEVETSRLSGTILYKVSEFAPRMGSVAAKPMPDYMARGVISKDAIKQLQ